MTTPPISELHLSGRPVQEKAAGQASVGRWTSAGLRTWGIRSVLSVLDQGITASVGFGVNVFLARWLSADTYGAFAVAFAGFIFISGFHNVLLLEPLTVMGPSKHVQRLTVYFREQLVIHALLVGALSAIVLPAGVLLWWFFPQRALSGALIGSGLAMPFLLLLWLVRRMCYVLQRPSAALLGSTFYVCFVFCGLLLLHYCNRANPLWAFLLMGTGSLLAACLLLRQLGLTGASGVFASGPLRCRDAWHQNWQYGRWLVASTTLFSASSQIQVFLAASTLGLGAAGILRAMQIPSLVMTQVVAASGLLILPAFSYDFGKGSIPGMRRKATLVNCALAAATLTFVAVLQLFSRRVEHVLYGAKYADHAWLMPILALVPAAIGSSIGYSMALRASQKPHFDLIANAVAAPVGIGSAIVLMRWWGLAGAAASMVLSYATYAAVTCWVYRVSPQLHHSPSRSEQWALLQPETQESARR